jgi:hypothetical protein
LKALTDSDYTLWRPVADNIDVWELFVRLTLVRMTGAMKAGCHGGASRGFAII